MAIPVMILGESGVGKSTSMRNLSAQEAVIVQPIKKPLPFRNQFKYMTKDGGQIFACDNAESICSFIERAAAAGKKQIIIDDFQYIMANEFMRRYKERGYDKYSDIGYNAWSIINKAQALDSDARVYFMAHTENDASGKVKIKTIGKMLDEKITLEGMCTIVLGAGVTDGKYHFTTQNGGNDTLKSPMGMFQEMTIDNDLKVVDETIKEYYNY